MGDGGFISNFVGFESRDELAPGGDLSIYRSIDPSIDLWIYLSGHLSICSIHILTYLWICLSSLSICLSISLSIYPSLYPTPHPLPALSDCIRSGGPLQRLCAWMGCGGLLRASLPPPLTPQPTVEQEVS